MDSAVTVLGLAVEKLRAVFSPDSTNPPIGGGTDTVHLLAGDTVIPPPELIGDEDTGCQGCGPYLWVRLVRRWRTANFPLEQSHAPCGTARAITIEAGIARCHPLDGTPEEMERHAAVQWDDSDRIDRALCAALKAAKGADVVSEYGLGPGTPIGPDGLVVLWFQIAHAELSKR